MNRASCPQPAAGDPPRDCYDFDQFRVDAARRLLLRAGAPVRLTPKAFETLLALARNGGRVMSKSELMSLIWPDSFVEEGNLAQNIFLLRRALGEGKNDHRYIVTIPGSGYLFVPRAGEPCAAQEGRDAARAAPPADDRAVRSLAVLPFKPLAEEDGDRPLGAGVADALITRLTGLRGVRVLPTSAVLRFGERSQVNARAAAELGVDALLDGLYQRDGGQLRVSVQLVRARDNVTLWAAKFDAEFTTLFAVQDAVSEEVAKALALMLGCGERRRAPFARGPRRAVARRAAALHLRRRGLRGV